MTELLAEFPPASPILDVGCGFGDLAIHLAAPGLEVLGIDFVDAAIAQAQEKAHALPAEVRYSLEFRVADALQLSRPDRQFGSVMDSGFLHSLGRGESDRFVEELTSLLSQGGRYYLLAFTVEFPRPSSPRRISEDELRARFIPEKGWQIRHVRPVEFKTLMIPIPAIRACIERLPVSGA